MVAIPLSFALLSPPGANPAGSGPLATIVEFGGLLAALASFLLGRQARISGDISSAAIWGPRLGAAALLGLLLLRLGAGTPAG